MFTNSNFTIPRLSSIIQVVTWNGSFFYKFKDYPPLSISRLSPKLHRIWSIHTTQRNKDRSHDSSPFYLNSCRYHRTCHLCYVQIIMMKSRNNLKTLFHRNNLHHDDADALEELEQRFPVLPTLGDGDPGDNCKDDQAQDVGGAAREEDH